MDETKYIKDLTDALQKEGKGKAYTNACVKYATRLIRSNLPVIFDTKHLALLIGINAEELCKMIFAEYLFYIEKQIPKKSGGARQLFIPSINLKYVQRWILDNILINMTISEHATGFRENSSIVTNAIKHTAKDCVINMDIKDFFPTINMETVFRIFHYYGYTKEVAFVLAKLCTYEGVLPQGSPASPYLSNISCLKVDKRISKLVEKYQADYTRYADDITISGNYGLSKCKNIIKEILNEEGFQANDKKTRIAFKHERQVVTGLIVNEANVKVSKKYKRELKKEIYFCTKFGVSEHLAKIDCNKSFYKEHLYGKAYFINMVEPSEGKKFLELLDKIEWDY